MRRTLYFIFLALSITSSKAITTDTIPNGGFESWSIIGWSEVPRYWVTNNSNLLAPIIVPDSDSYSGSLAMKVSYMSAFQPRASCNFLLTGHPLNIGGYARNELGPGDSVMIVARLFYNQVIVDSGYAVMYGGFNPLYSPFIVSISQNSSTADSCEIVITGGMTLETSITFDDLQFDFLQEVYENFNRNFSFYPNPCSDRVVINIKHSGFVPGKIEAYNMLGQFRELEIVNQSAVDYIVEVNTSVLDKGMWLLMIRSDNESYSFLLQKN